MKVWLTGGTGFVGSNIVDAALDHGADVMTTVHSFVPPDDAGYRAERVDMRDSNAVRNSIRRFGPDVVIHCAILNDWDLMYSDRAGAWESYVTATGTVADAAAEAGAAFVVVSTDWVFDGTQTGADEATPPNPVNLYGVLKLASEITALERGGAVARVSGVNGIHRARPTAPRLQDPGFGYFVASLVDNLKAGTPFTVWEADNINMIATPSLASESAGMILDIGQRGLNGIFHCCGADSVTRHALADLACKVFEIDSSHLRFGQPPAGLVPPVPIPYDTSIKAPRTSELLERVPTPLRELLMRFREEYEAYAA
ncbi:MAG: NAD-dependent epimerase/dehydratase family protein [Acidobacteria bacterium]|nr:MAG: NAD-dependent epimerase/dehydratase family protein [Acidobacteriota bacterium]